MEIAFSAFFHSATGGTGSFTNDPKLRWFVLVPVLLALYYLAVLYRTRQTFPGSTVITQYSPPSGMSPAEMRYVLTGEFDEKFVVADVIHLAARGLVRFEGLDKYYAVGKTGAALPADLPADELAVYRAMFNLENAGKPPFPGRLRTYDELPHDSFLLPPPGERNFALLDQAIRKALHGVTEQKYFTANIPFIAPAAALSLFLVFLRPANSQTLMAADEYPVVALLAAIAITLGVLALEVPEQLFGINAKRMPGNTAAIRLLFFLACLGALGALGAGSVVFLVSVALFCG